MVTVTISYVEAEGISSLFTYEQFINDANGASDASIITLGEGWTDISNGAFQDAINLTEITIPASVQNIGVNVFTGAINLTKINVDLSNNHYVDISGVLFDFNKTNLIQYPIGSDRTSYDISLSVTTIGPTSFQDASSILTSVNIPSSVITIGSSAFQSAIGLQVVTLNDISNSQLTTIGSSAFQGAISLSSIVIPDSVTTIGSSAFQNASELQTVTFENISNSQLTTIENNVFDSTSLNTITIPDSVTNINTQSFYNVNTLTKINISNNSRLLTISEQAFQYTSIEEIILPNTLRTIGANAFLDSSLNIVYMTLTTNGLLNNILDTDILFDTPSPFFGNDNVTVKNINKVTHIIDVNNDNYFIDISGELSKGSYENDISFNNIQYIRIGENVTSISINTFNGANNLSLVTFPNDLTSKINVIGSSAFQGATSLSSILIPNSVTTIGSSAFQGATSLSSILIPNSVTTIGSSAFQGATSLSSIVIPNSVTTIGSSAFQDDISLSSVVIPYTITDISNTVFYNTPSLQSIQFNSNNISYISTLSTINEQAFSYSGIANIILNTPYISSINNTSFQDSSLNTVAMWQSTINTFNEINNTNIKVGYNDTFYGKSDVTIITPSNTLIIHDLSNSVYNIVANLTNLSDINASNTIESVNIGTIVTSIAANTFRDLSGIKYITIPYTINAIESNAFIGTSSLEYFVVDPSNIYFADISGILFNKEITNLIQFPSNQLAKTQFSIPYTVNSIGPHAFQDVSSVLEQINIPKSVVDICSNSFTNSNIDRIVFDESTNLDTLGLTIGDNVSFYDIITNISFITKIFNGTGDLSGATNDLSGGTMVRIEGYSSIGTDAFKDASGLTHISIPFTVTSIGTSAFQGIPKMESITIPASVTSIGDYAFNGDSSLNNLYIPGSISSIGVNAFQYASELTNVTMLQTTADILGLTVIGTPITFYGKDGVIVTIVEHNQLINRVITNSQFVTFINDNISSTITEDTIETYISSSFPTTPDNKYIQYKVQLTINGNKLDDVSKYKQTLLINLVKTIYAKEIGLIENKLIVTLTTDSANININIDVLKSGVIDSMVPICFPSGTLITTEQGDIAIEKLDPDIHTIRGKKILGITQTKPIFDYIISIERNALGRDLPSITTKISKEHKVFYKGKMIKAKDLVDLCKNVTQIPYNGEFLYNVLMEKHDKMLVHNLICETLDPENIMAKICRSKCSMNMKNKIYAELNKIIKTNNVGAYKSACDYISSNL